METIAERFNRIESLLSRQTYRGEKPSVEEILRLIKQTLSILPADTKIPCDSEPPCEIRATINSTQTYEIFAILAKKNVCGQDLFLIKWVGYNDPKDFTWETLENLKGDGKDVESRMVLAYIKEKAVMLEEMKKLSAQEKEGKLQNKGQASMIVNKRKKILPYALKKTDQGWIVKVKNNIYMSPEYFMLKATIALSYYDMMILDEMGTLSCNACICDLLQMNRCVNNDTCDSLAKILPVAIASGVSPPLRLLPPAPTNATQSKSILALPSPRPPPPAAAPAASQQPQASLPPPQATGTNNDCKELKDKWAKQLQTLEDSSNKTSACKEAVEYLRWAHPDKNQDCKSEANDAAKLFNVFRDKHKCKNKNPSPVTNRSESRRMRFI